MQFSLCLHELQWLIIIVDDFLLPKNVMSPLATGLHNGIDLFVISGILLDCVGKCLTVICHWMPMLSKDCPNSIVRGICLDLKWLFKSGSVSTGAE